MANSLNAIDFQSDIVECIHIIEHYRYEIADLIYKEMKTTK